MTLRTLAIDILVSCSLVFSGGARASDEGTPEGNGGGSTTPGVGADDRGNNFYTSGKEALKEWDHNQPSTRRNIGSPSDAPDYEYSPTCGVGGQEVCVTTARCPDGSPMLDVYVNENGTRRYLGPHCFNDRETPVAARPQITNAMVMRAFRRIEVPSAKLVVQPPGGKTLVNFDTLFHTEAESFTRTVRLLGQRVDLAITPSSFTWQHGDGTAQTTGNPGVPYAEWRPMSDYVSHSYVDAHVTVRPSVDTTYSARFRVNGGAWRDVVGTVTIDGSPVPVRVVEGRPTLVDAG